MHIPTEGSDILLFCVVFQRVKYLTHTFKDVIYLQRLDLRARKRLWNAPLVLRCKGIQWSPMDSLTKAGNAELLLWIGQAETTTEESSLVMDLLNKFELSHFSQFYHFPQFHVQIQVWFNFRLCRNLVSCSSKSNIVLEVRKAKSGLQTLIFYDHHTA